MWLHWQMYERIFGQSINAKNCCKYSVWKDLMTVLPYLGKRSLQILTGINRVTKNKLPYCNLEIVFHKKCSFIDLFTYKDKIPVFLLSGIVYKFNRGGCNAIFYSKTKRHFKVRMFENLGVSALTGKRMKGFNEILLQKNIIYFAIIYLVLTIFPY